MTEQEFVMDIIDEVLDCPMFQSAIAVNEAVKDFFLQKKLLMLINCRITIILQ